MNKVIIYQNQEGCLNFVYPAPNSGLSLEEICRKDVPANTSYLIADVSDVPTDFTFYEAFEADFSNPDGTGIGPDAWFAAKAAEEAAAEQTEEVPE